MSRITHDVSRLRDFIANGLQEIVGDFLTIIYICALMFSFHWKLALWTLIPIPVSHLLHNLFWQEDEQGVPCFMETVREH